MRIFYGILLIIAFSSSVFAAREPIPDNQAILQGEWQPTSQDTKRALESVATFIQKSGVPQISNLPSYAVQFIGKFDHGEKIIICNFFPASGIKSEFPDWRTTRVEVMDGGSGFWHVTYEPKSNTCSDLSINGVAFFFSYPSPFNACKGTLLSRPVWARTECRIFTHKST